MAEYMHLIGAEQVQSAAGTIRDAAERISTAAWSMHDSIMRGLERADELVTRMEALDEQHRAALAQIERWRPVVEAAETQATVHTAVRRRADNQSLNDYGAAIDATNQAVRAMRAQAKESEK